MYPPGSKHPNLSPRIFALRGKLCILTIGILVILACSFIQASQPGDPASTLTDLTAMPQKTSTPDSSAGISISNYQKVARQYQWNVESDILNITGIALSPHADKVALLTVRYKDQYSLELREPQTGILIWKVALGEKAGYPAIAFSPDSTMIAVGLDHGNVVIYNITDGRIIQTLTGQTYAVRMVKFSPNGKLVAAGASDNTAQVWQISNAMNLGSHTVATDVRDIAFSPDGKFLAVTTNYVNVYGVASSGDNPTVFYDTAGDTQNMGQVAFFPNGLFLAAEGNWLNPGNNRWRPRILIWDFPSNLTSPTKIPLQFNIEDLEISPDGQLLVGDYTGQGQLLFINLTSREIIGSINLGPKLYMAYSADFSQFAIVSSKTSVTIWGLSN
jgi:WD40 repeat protein